MLRSFAMLSMAFVCGVVLAGGTNVLNYAEPFTTHDNGKAITNITGWSAGSADRSVVSNLVSGYTLDDLTFPITNYTHSSNNKVINLNTEGNTLTNTLGGANFSADPIYVDTMVSFIVSDEDMPSSVSNDVNVKAAVFANATSNLVIYCGGLETDFSGFTASKFVETTTKIVPGTWYRLTVTMDALTGTANIQAFEVKLNNVAVTSAVAYPSNWKDIVVTEAPTGGSWFLSAANKPGQDGTGDDKVTINSLAFQGTGLLDDLVVTDEEPIFVIESFFVISHNITGSGSANGQNPLADIVIVEGGSTQVVYSATEYWQISALEIDESPVAQAEDLALYTQNFNNVSANIDVDVTFVRPLRTITQSVGAHGESDSPGATIEVLNGASTTITYTASSDWYTNTVTAGMYGVAAGNGATVATLTFTEVLGNTTADAVFTLREDGAAAEGVPTDWAANWGEEISYAWASANEEAMQIGYMLNGHPTNVATVVISAMSVDNGTLTVTVLLTDNGEPAANRTINGTLRIFEADSLADTFTEIVTEALVEAAFDANGKAVFDFTEADPTKFYKAKITLD